MEMSFVLAAGHVPMELMHEPVMAAGRREGRR